MSISVLLVDDENLVRAGFRLILEAENIFASLVRPGTAPKR